MAVVGGQSARHDTCHDTCHGTSEDAAATRGPPEASASSTPLQFEEARERALLQTEQARERRPGRESDASVRVGGGLEMEGETAWERSAWSHAHEMSPESVEKRPFRQRGCSVEFGRNGEGSVVQSVVKSCSTASGGGGLSEMVWGRLLEAQLKDMEESIRLVCRSSSPPGHTYAYA